MTPRLSIVAPCYNEAAGLEEFHRRISAAAEETVGADYELILLNDGSTDGTWSLLAELTRADPHLVAVNLSRRHGHQLAMTAGLQICRGARILAIDADLQDPPELLGEMWRLMERSEVEVVYGVRRERQGETAVKRGTAALFYRLMRRIGYADLPVDSGDFRLMTRRILDILNAMPEQHRFIRGMVSWIGLRQVALPYDRAPRHAGASSYSLARMIGLAFDALTSFFDRAAAARLPSRHYRRHARPPDAWLYARQLGARPCRRRLDQPDHGGADPRQHAAHSVRPPRRICRPTLSGNQAPAVVRHRPDFDAGRFGT
jgi:polyisoprenyl-phosphate glycosyltransferase